MKTTNNETSSTEGTVTVSRAEYEELKRENERLSNENRWLAEQVTLARKNKFGSKADKVSDEAYEQMSLMFDEPEAIAWVESVQEKKEVAVAAHSRTRKTGALKDIIPDNIPVEVEEHRLEGKDLICEVCGSRMTEIGKTVKQSLKIIPEQVIIHEDWYYSYACKTCEKAADSTPVVKAPRDDSILPGSYASPEAVAHIMTQKYVMGVPLYRQEQELNRKQIMLSRQTMSNWVIKCSEKWLTPIYEELHRKLLQEDIIHADETALQVLHEPGKTPQTESFMWLYRTGKYASHPIVLYEYRPDRKQGNPKAFLTDFAGYLQTDGYGGYNSVEGVTHVGCMAHLRRKFTDAEKAAPKGTRSPTISTAIAYCSKLFDIEKELADLGCEERYARRQAQARPVIDEFYAWVLTRNASQKSKLGIALTYAKNQMPIIRNYLLDGRLEISNNLAERSIKPFVIDRKNFLFANTPAGADSSAVTFSIIETARESGLDPFRYLEYVFRKAPILSHLDNNWVTALLPENAPDTCRVQ
jgi:transposase